MSQVKNMRIFTQNVNITSDCGKEDRSPALFTVWEAPVGLDVAVTSPNQQGSLALRLSIAFIHRRPLFYVVIPLFIFWVLQRPENQTVRRSHRQTDTHTHTHTHTPRPRHKQLHWKKSIFYKPSSPVVRHKEHVKLKVKQIWQTCLIEIFMGLETVWYNEAFCTVPSDIGHSMWPSLLCLLVGGCRTPHWRTQNGQSRWLVMTIITHICHEKAWQ